MRWSMIDLIGCQIHSCAGRSSGPLPAYRRGSSGGAVAGDGGARALSLFGAPAAPGRRRGKTGNANRTQLSISRGNRHAFAVDDPGAAEGQVSPTGLDQTVPHPHGAFVDPGPVTVTILALRMASVRGFSAMAQGHSSSRAGTSFLINKTVTELRLLQKPGR